MPVLSSFFPFNKLTRSQHIPWDPGTLGLSDHLWPRSCFPITTPRTPGHWKTVVVAAWSVGNHQDLVEMESLQVGRNGTSEGALVGPRNVCLMCALECKSSKRLDLTWVDLISKPKPLSLAFKKYVPFFSRLVIAFIDSLELVMFHSANWSRGYVGFFEITNETVSRRKWWELDWGIITKNRQWFVIFSYFFLNESDTKSPEHFILFLLIYHTQPDDSRSLAAHSVLFRCRV